MEWISTHAVVSQSDDDKSSMDWSTVGVPPRLENVPCNEQCHMDKQKYIDDWVTTRKRKLGIPENMCGDCVKWARYCRNKTPYDASINLSNGWTEKMDVMEMHPELQNMLLSTSNSVDTYNKHWTSAMRCAIFKDHLPCLEYAIKLGCFWNERIRILCARMDCIKSLQYLIDNGSTKDGCPGDEKCDCVHNINHECPKAGSAMASAAMRGYTDCVQILFDKYGPWHPSVLYWALPNQMNQGVLYKEDVAMALHGLRKKTRMFHEMRRGSMRILKFRVVYRAEMHALSPGEFSVQYVCGAPGHCRYIV